MNWLRSHIGIVVINLLVLFVLFAADALCYAVALPIEIDVRRGVATLHVGTQTIPLGMMDTPTTLIFSLHDPVVHEYQLDDTDSTNNFSLDPVYLDSIVSSPYYRFQSWMRDLDGTSRWRNLQIWVDGRPTAGILWPANGASVSLPRIVACSGEACDGTAPTSLRLTMQLQRPETPMTFNLLTKNGSTWQITLDRNDRYIQVMHFMPTPGATAPEIRTFFPLDIAPFAAMVIDSLIRILIWAEAVLLVVLVGEALIVLVRVALTRRIQKEEQVEGNTAGHLTNAGILAQPLSFQIVKSRYPAVVRGYRRNRCRFRSGQYVTKSLHPVALLALVGSFVFVAWIARVQYNAEPHIYDAAAYLFAAKMYAIGQLSVPAPPAVDRFPGPFMVLFNGRWFTQYPPGTSLTLVPGILLGVPWLVEPLLGTFALLGIGLVAARLYNRGVATLAVLLGVLSPFYSYLAASYLSHAIALFYLVWGLWAFVCFVQGGADWNMPLSAALFGMAFLTRDLVALLFIAIVVPGSLILLWRRERRGWQRWFLPGVAFIGVMLTFWFISLSFNALLTGSPWLSPRSLFFSGDHWGFGQGVGFYGQHTLAAGLVNLDELLTSLAIDLYGWPFYLTLVFLAIPFLTRRTVRADWLMLVGAIIMTGAWVGYFYHGIYLGPRYLYEILPFLLMLTARGILVLASVALDAGSATGKWFGKKRLLDLAPPRTKVSVLTVVLVAILVGCNLLYFMPRQVVLHTNYSGLPNGYNIDLSEVYSPPVHNAIVVTDDYTMYQFVLFPLNDPLLHNDVIYAWASNVSDYEELRSAFPTRALYRLDVASDGSVKYVALKE